MRRFLAGTLLRQFAWASFLVILALGLALGWALGRAIEQSALNELAGEARDTLYNRVLGQILPDDFDIPMTGSRYAAFHGFVEESVVSERTARIKIWNPQGTVVYSSEASQVGQAYPIKEELAAALRGEMASELARLEEAENVEERQFGRLLEVYVPIVFSGSDQVQGAFEIYQSYDLVAHQVQETQNLTYGGLGLGLSLLYLTLFGIVKRGSDTIRHQQTALEESYEATLVALSTALDLRDKETEGHSLRVAQMAVAVAREMGVHESQIPALERGALLHDVGKIGISDTILLKPGPLTAEEWEVMRQHPLFGERMLATVPFLIDSRPLILHHHERWDGKGYPGGLKGEGIPLRPASLRWWIPMMPSAPTAPIVGAAVMRRPWPRSGPIRALNSTPGLLKPLQSCPRPCVPPWMPVTGLRPKWSGARAAPEAVRPGPSGQPETRLSATGLGPAPCPPGAAG